LPDFLVVFLVVFLDDFLAFFAMALLSPPFRAQFYKAGGSESMIFRDRARFSLDALRAVARRFAAPPTPPRIARSSGALASARVSLLHHA
jgi:hypothetical protein